MTDERRTAWIATQKDNLFILIEQDMRNKVFAMNLDNQEFAMIHGSRKTVLGKLLKVDISPEALLEDLDMREGQRLLLLPAGSVSRGRVVGYSPAS